MKLFSLANQIALALSGLSLLLIAVMGVLNTLLIQNILEKHMLEDRQLIASNISTPLESFFTEQRQEMQSSINYQLPQSGSAQVLSTSFRLLLARNADFLELALISPTGETVVSESRDGNILFDNIFAVRQARWFREAQQGRNYISELYFTSRQEPYIFLSQPALQTTYAGYVLVSRLSMRILWSTLNQQSISGEDHNYIVDADGHLIADSEQERAAPSNRIALPVALKNVQHPFAGRYENQALVLGATSPIEGTSWIAINEVSTHVTHDEIQQVRTSVALLMITGAIVALVVGRILAHQITQPLRALGDLARKLEAGEYLYQVHIPNPPEATVLALTFNRMGQVIAEREAELKKANTSLRLRTEELATLSRQLIAVEEEERRRISREVHDGFGQTLAALKMTLDVAQKLPPSERKDHLLSEASQIVKQAIDEAHNISQNLRPTVLDDLGLIAALEWYIHQSEQRFGIPVQYEIPQEPIQLSAEGEIAAFRFFQEALTNIYKHAQATHITVKLRQQANFLMLAVKDNGIGFNANLKLTPSTRIHLGLSGLRERLSMIGGELVIHSIKGEGTTLIALLPTKPE